MKKILGLDLGVGSIGWALVNEAENEQEHSSIVDMGVRVLTSSLKKPQYYNWLINNIL